MYQSTFLIAVLLIAGLGLLAAALVGRGQANPMSLLPRAGFALAGLLAWAVGYYLYQHAQVLRPQTASTTAWADGYRSRQAVGAERAAAQSSSSADALEASVNQEPEPAPVPALGERLIEIDRPNAPVVAAKTNASGGDTGMAQLAAVPSAPVVPAPTAAPVLASAPVVPVLAYRPSSATPSVAEPLVASTTPMRKALSHSPRHIRPSRAPRVATPVGGMSIMVSNELEDDQSQESLSLAIEGRTVAQLNVNNVRTRTSANIHLPRPGYLNYTLTGSSLKGGYTRIQGKGCIEMLPGARFTVLRSPDGLNVQLAPVRSRRS